MRLSRTTRILAAGLTAGALAAPPAFARPAPLDYPVTAESGAETAPPVVRIVDQGFDWGSAAIGAGGAGALIALASLGGFGYASRADTRAAR